MKSEVKNVVSFIGKFEESVVRYARDYDVDGVLCGHIHTAATRNIQGIEYYNTGDWVESSTAIVERYDGTLELIHHQPSEPSEPLSTKFSEEEEHHPLPEFVTAKNMGFPSLSPG